jgi:hypothetical protein
MCLRMQPGHQSCRQRRLTWPDPTDRPKASCQEVPSVRTVSRPRDERQDDLFRASKFFTGDCKRLNRHGP